MRNFLTATKDQNNQQIHSVSVLAKIGVIVGCNSDISICLRCVLAHDLLFSVTKDMENIIR
jgi:hypothetical protein